MDGICVFVCVGAGCYLRVHCQLIRFLNVDVRKPHSITTEVPVALMGLDLAKYALSAALFLDMRPQVPSFPAAAVSVLPRFLHHWHLCSCCLCVRQFDRQVEEAAAVVEALELRLTSKASRDWRKVSFGACTVDLSPVLSVRVPRLRCNLLSESCQ